MAPRLPARPDDGDRAAAYLRAAVIAAHFELAATDGTPEGPPALVAAWERRPGGRTLRVIYGARPSPVAFPGAFLPGSVVEPLDAADVVAGWHAFPAWCRCLGRAEPLAGTGGAAGPGGTAGALARGGFADYVGHLGRPFVWLVTALPLPADAVEDRIARLEAAIPGLRRRENSEAGRVDLVRAQARYRELAQARVSGAWEAHVLVGGPTPTDARAAAALLCSAVGLHGEPYALAPGGRTAALGEALATTVVDGDAPRSPFVATAGLLAALVRPPERELPGVRLVERADFDVTPENRGEVVLGQVLDDADRPVGPFTVGTDTLNRHGLIVGATGAGKSQTVRHLLEQLDGLGIPWLVVEPTKAEYARMAGRIGDDRVRVVHPGAPDAVPVGLNPLEPEPGFPLQTHLDLVRALFLAAFQADEPFPQVLGHALVRCYEGLGWDPIVSASRIPGITPRYPRLADLQRTALDVVEGVGYGKEVADNVRGFIDVRLSSLRLGTPGRFFEGGYPLDVGDLMAHNVVLEIEDIGNDEDKAFFIGAVLIRIYEHLRVRQGPAGGRPGLRHVTVIEEAHRLLRRVEPGTPAAHAIELCGSLLAEVRAYGEGILVAEQIPTKILPDVLKNTALKVVHRLPAADDRDAVGGTMNLDDAQSRHIVTLPPGRAVVFADRMDRPIRITVPDGERRERRAASPAPVMPAEEPVPPLSLRDLNAAERLAAEPRVVLWAELLVVAHLAGRPSPRPGRPWLDELARRAARPVLRRAIAEALRSAVDARYGALVAYYQPESLTRHLLAAAWRTLGGGAPCPGGEVGWQAGSYRWVDVLDALRNVPATPAARVRPHPDTPSWAARGLDLPGPTVDDQLAQLRHHPDYWHPSHALVNGSGNPPAYQRAVDALAPAGDPTAAFLRATRHLGLPDTWPLVVFHIPPPTPK